MTRTSKLKQVKERVDYLLVLTTHASGRSLLAWLATAELIVFERVILLARAFLSGLLTLLALLTLLRVASRCLLAEALIVMLARLTHVPVQIVVHSVMCHVICPPVWLINI
jgi:hypothetical protein